MSFSISKNVVVLVSSYKKTDQFVDSVAEALRRNWPSAPAAVFVSDSGDFRAEPKVVIRETSWISLMRKAVTTVKKYHPDATHVFSLIEDHCPLQLCDDVLVGAYLSEAMAQGYAMVMFPTFFWPWRQPAEIGPYLSPDRTEPVGFEIVEKNSLKFAAIPHDFFRYYSVQPSLWEIDYFLEICGAAESQTISDPWAFEAMQWSGARQHYVAGYNWPTVHHGFLVQGAINPHAIFHMDPKRSAGLRGQLLRQTIGIDSLALYRAFLLGLAIKRVATRWWQRLL